MLQTNSFISNLTHTCEVFQSGMFYRKGKLFTKQVGADASVYQVWEVRNRSSKATSPVVVTKIKATFSASQVTFFRAQNLGLSVEVTLRCPLSTEAGLHQYTQVRPTCMSCQLAQSPMTKAGTCLVLSSPQRSPLNFGEFRPQSVKAVNSVAAPLPQRVSCHFNSFFELTCIMTT